jgi:SAM-dependent methyltransferase
MPSTGRLSAREVRKLNRQRLSPRPTQFDYLHLRELLAGLRMELTDPPSPTHDVLDVYCGTRPYEALLPAGVEYVGMDVVDYAGVADVVTDEFLPFADESFDLVLCLEGFDYVRDPLHGVSELRRVLRPGGKLVMTVSLVWEYRRDVLQHRYTGPSLAALFDDGWDDVEVRENGGMAVAWAFLSGRIARRVHDNLPRALRIPLAPLFTLVYLLVNGAGAALDWAERSYARSSATLPMNLMVSARRPAAASG